MEVVLHIYDLSGGLAKQMSMAMVGKQFDGIWHTGVVVFGQEFFFGGGIQQGSPGRTPYGFPVQKLSLGTTHIPEDVMQEFLREISPRFTFETYNILANNCNNFSNELSVFLTGSGIPQYILDLPKEALSTPLGGMIQQMLTPRQGGNTAFSFQPAAQSRPTAAAAASSSSSSSPSSGVQQQGSSAAGAAGERNDSVTAARKHMHDKLDLPTLSSFDRPFVLNQVGDKGCAAIERLRKLQASHHEDKGTDIPKEEVDALSDLGSYLDQPPSDASPPLSRGCYRLMARVLSEWPVASWGPMLDLLRLLLLYAPVNKHYAKSVGNPVPIIVRRCILNPEVARPVQLRALFAVVNVFAHEAGGKSIVRDGEGHGVMEAAMDLIRHTDLATRMSAAAVLYNISRLLPKEETVEVLQLGSGLAHHLQEKTDGETALRLMLSMSRLAHRNDAAVSLLRSLEFDPLKVEVEDNETDNLRHIKRELAVILSSTSMV